MAGQGIHQVHTQTYSFIIFDSTLRRDAQTKSGWHRLPPRAIMVEIENRVLGSHTMSENHRYI